MVQFTLEAGSRAQSDPRLLGERDAHRRAQLHGSCIVSAERCITDWAPASFAELLPVHLEAILALGPEVVLIGTGPMQRFASGDCVALLPQRGVGVEVMQLGAACRTFNVLVQEERRVAAALFLQLRSRESEGDRQKTQGEGQPTKQSFEADRLEQLHCSFSCCRMLLLLFATPSSLCLLPVTLLSAVVVRRQGGMVNMSQKSAQAL